MPELKRPLHVFLCHAHVDRDPVRALPEGARLTKDGVDAWLLARSPKGLLRTEQGILSSSPTQGKRILHLDN